MPNTRQINARTPPENFVATLTLRGHEFPFRLFRRPVRLGPGTTVQYYWMDSSQFRSLRSVADAANFRSVVGFWVAAMQEMGWHRELDQQVHFILALSYSLVCRRKSLQNIVLDAYLTPETSRRGYSVGLPEEIRSRINEVVASRDRMQVQAELSELLKRFVVPPRMLPLLQEAFRRWVGRGVVLMRQHDNQGVEQFLTEADSWLQRFRKRSDPWVRHFLDLFAYECKAAFHTCYANAWIGLIPWLREHCQLDPISERFLRFWHNQNQAIEIPHGQTSSGIIYPTHRGLVFPNSAGGHPSAPQAIRVASEQIGPTHIPDVMLGQVLSLHPISAFFMKDAALCAIAGEYFTSDEYTDAQTPQLVGRCPKYWNLVGAILTAAHVYRQSVEQQALGRGVRLQQGAETAAQQDVDKVAEASAFEDFATRQRMNCHDCRGRLRFASFTPVETGDPSVSVEYVCTSCCQPTRRQVAFSDLVPWLNATE